MFMMMTVIMLCVLSSQIIYTVLYVPERNGSGGGWLCLTLNLHSFYSIYEDGWLVGVRLVNFTTQNTQTMIGRIWSKPAITGGIIWWQPLLANKFLAHEAYPPVPQQQNQPLSSILCSGKLINSHYVTPPQLITSSTIWITYTKYICASESHRHIQSIMRVLQIYSLCSLCV